MKGVAINESAMMGNTINLASRTCALDDLAAARERRFGLMGRLREMYL